MSKDLLDSSFGEFVEHRKETEVRINSVKTIQDRLLNHISTLENINQLLETRIASTKDPEVKIRLSKALTYNFEKLTKLYDVYRAYEDTVQKYFSLTADTINKKYRLEFDRSKTKSDGTSADFFRQLNAFLVENKGTDMNDLTTVEDSDLQL